MVITKYTKSEIEYFVYEFEKKYPQPRFLKIQILQSIKTNLEANTCKGLNSYMIENFDTPKFGLQASHRNNMNTKWEVFLYTNCWIN